MKKILLLTASAGEGHNSMCRAVSGYLKETYEDAKVLQYDLYKDGTKTFRKKLANWMLGKGYFFVIKLMPKFANKDFQKLKRTDFRKKSSRLLRFNFITPAVKSVKKLLAEFQPDAIFSAHTFSGIILNDLRKQGDENAKKAKIVTIVSDFDVAPYTELLPDMDFFVTPTEDFAKELLARGVDTKKIFPFGIPTQTKFAKVMDKEEAKKKLGIDLQKKVVMLMGGGLGFGNMAKLVLRLNECKTDFQIVCVCGKNAKMKRKLERLKKRGKIKKEITIFGFSNEVDVIMSAADVLISKIGGLSSTEAFNKNLPLIVLRKLPFQENDNMNYIRNLGACEYIDKDKNTAKIIDIVLSDSDKSESMKKATKKLSRPEATKNIGDLLYFGEVKDTKK